MADLSIAVPDAIPKDDRRRATEPGTFVNALLRDGLARFADRESAQAD
ncbi:MAG: hypothetical protein ACTS6J_25685 [Burkholderiales bacterium]